jgi:hypothetical protein
MLLTTKKLATRAMRVDLVYTVQRMQVIAEREGNPFGVAIKAFGAAMALAAESILNQRAPVCLASSRAIDDFPLPGRPPKTMSIATAYLEPRIVNRSSRGCSAAARLPLRRPSHDTGRFGVCSFNLFDRHRGD